MVLIENNMQLSTYMYRCKVCVDIFVTDYVLRFLWLCCIRFPLYICLINQHYFTCCQYIQLVKVAIVVGLDLIWEFTLLVDCFKAFTILKKSNFWILRICICSEMYQILFHIWTVMLLQRNLEK